MRLYVDRLWPKLFSVAIALALFVAAHGCGNAASAQTGPLPTIGFLR